MPGARRGRSSIRLGIAFCAISVGASGALGQDHPPAAADDARERPNHLVVLRLSGAVLNSFVDKQIDYLAPVRDVVLGTPVSGVARVTGQPRVQLQPSSDQARFAVVVAGTVFSRTVGRSGPAVIHGHSITHFTATKEIVFEPGRGFYGLPPKVSAQSQSFTDAIQSTRGGIIGRFVTRKASREVADQQPELTAIARERAVRRIAAAFDQHMDHRLAKLNRAVELRSLLAAVGERAGNLRLVCSTTPHYVEIASSGADRSSPILLPVLASASDIGAPIEIWIHESLIPEKIGDAVKTIFSNPDESGILSALVLLPGTFGQDTTAAVSALVAENKVAVQQVGDWMVIELNTQPISNVLAAHTLRR